MSIEIKIPKIHRKLAVTKSRRVAVETADLHARANETLLALAFRDFISAGSKKIVVVAPNERNLKYLLNSWLIESKIKIRRFESCYSYAGNELWLFITREPKDLPVRRIDVLYVLDAHLISASPIDSLAKLITADTDIRVSGVFASRGSWFYQFSRGEVDLHRVNAQSVIAEFPDEVRNLLPAGDTRYPRLMDLQDVEPKQFVQPFAVFSRRRLKVRTDKKQQFLSAKQQAEAESQLGAGWATGRHGVPVVSYELSALQRKYLAMKRLAIAQGKRPHFLLLKYRRGGFTTLEQGLSYQVIAEQSNSFVATLAHTSSSTKRIFRIAQMYHQMDPKAPSRVDDDTSSRIELSNGSLFFIGTAGGQGFARGDTLQRVHGSEVSKWCQGPRQVELVDDLMAAIIGAASNGEVVLETTPDGREWFCQQYEDAKRGLNNFTPLFLPWFMDPTNTLRPGEYNAEEILDSLTEDENEVVQRHGLSVAQIAFRRQKKLEFKRLFLQEFPEDDVSCFLTSGTCFFDVELLLAMKKRLPPVTKTHTPGGYQVIVEEPIKGVEYCIGADTSEGLPGCDPNGAGVLRKDTGKQVAWVHGLFNPRVLADHCVRLATKYNNSLLGVERENHGHAVLQKIVDLGYGRPHFAGGNLYYCGQSHKDSMAETMKKSRAGWSTSAETRPVMLEELGEAIETGAMKVYDEDLLTEGLTFRLQSNGKFEADSGAHDDSVMKWAVAWQMRKHRKKTPQIFVAEGGL